MLQQKKTALIGLIVMGASASIEKEFHKNVPDQVQITTTRVPFGEVSYNGFLEVTRKCPDAAKLLMEAQPDVIAITSFLGGCIRGNELVNTLQQMTGIPALMPSSEMVRVLRQIKARRIAIVSIFSNEFCLLERMFFENMDISVVQSINMSETMETNPYTVVNICYEDMMEHLKAADFSDVDAVVFDHPMLDLNSGIGKELEKMIPVPFFSTTQVLLYSALKRVGEHTGHLFLSKFLD
ncbi:aspartate racemase/maleate isomerase family protein [Mediterraneibacter agrestimuris]|uniref:aspartate racemase/maleate isomerase family protein n=1 Tax=Mediterraneibacter agrestimuris TaxID=2941333 RepID=UPI002041FA5B|nr:hypothetical protein [Mediterraneibacter agrestimuris]